MKSNIISSILAVYLIWGCSQDDSSSVPEVSPQGTVQELRSYYSDSFVDAMLALGFNLSLGNTPPNIEGEFEVSPFILQKSSVVKDSNLIGNQYSTYTLEFSNQDNDLLTVDLKGSQGSLMDVGDGSFVVGSNNAFAVYTKTTTTDNDGTYPRETAIAISGTLTPNGIENLQFYGAMLDDNGDPDDRLIENNTGRLFIDGDGLSSKN
ncbi:MAG: hypothetical protein RIM83_09440 [Allomuricauda sp.]